MRNYRYLPVFLLVSLLLWWNLAFSVIVPRDIVLMIDNSGSMKKGDPGYLTKEAVFEFVKQLSGDTWVSLLIFDHRVNLAIPLSKASEKTTGKVLANLDHLDFRGKFTNIPVAMERAIYELTTQGRKEAQKSILFITDGIVDTGNKTKDADSARWLRDILAEDAAGQGIRIYGIAFTSFADVELIQTLAQKTGGKYLRAATPKDILEAFSLAKQYILKQKAKTVILSPPALPQPQDSTTEFSQETIEDGPIYITAEPAPTVVPGDSPLASSSADPLPAAAEPTAPTTPVEPKKLNFLPLIFLILGMLILIAFLFWFQKKRNMAPLDRKSEYPAIDPTDPLPTASLKDIGGVTGKTMINITRKVTKVGRIVEGQIQRNTAAYLAIDRATISRNHAVIEYQSHIFWITDLGSANGTFLNNRRLTTKMPLKNGDVISFDTFDFDFVMEGNPQLDETIIVDQTVIRKV